MNTYIMYRYSSAAYSDTLINKGWWHLTWIQMRLKYTSGMIYLLLFAVSIRLLRKYKSIQVYDQYIYVYRLIFKSVLHPIHPVWLDIFGPPCAIQRGYGSVARPHDESAPNSGSTVHPRTRCKYRTPHKRAGEQLQTKVWYLNFP